ncbi:hypothetical protein GA0070611_4277 [Micromonospora auratinigra]|uniref:DUF3592 domain-containing protein n=1 Tax=Micromonospora auratinigra TaxID=261654 RepID=A0A1A8ZYP0_9ACTN|nr:hypothetical protein GA0070611_4277 [Micromonospora auratinigra]
MFHLAIGLLVDRAHLRERGRTTRAVVEGISETRRKPVLEVRFSTPDGRSVHGRTVELPEPRPSRGELVTVVYDPARPEEVYLPGGGPPLFVVAYLSTLGLVIVGPFGWHLRRTWRHRCDQAEDWRHHRPARSPEERRSHRPKGKRR